MARKSIFPDRCTLKLQDMDCSDIPSDLSNWSPHQPDNVAFPLNLTIGCNENAGTNHFQVIVATHNQTHFPLTKEDKRITQWFETYSYQALCVRLDEIISDCSTGDWDSSVEKLRKISKWEYEGFK